MIYLVEIELFYENNLESYFSETKNIIHLVETDTPKRIIDSINEYYKNFETNGIVYKVNKINYINKIIKK